MYVKHGSRKMITYEKKIIVTHGFAVKH